MLRLDMDEVNLQPVDLGHKLGQGVELCLHLAPVIFGLPEVDKRLNLRQLDTLGAICDCLTLRPAGGGDAPVQVEQSFFGNVDAKGSDFTRLALRPVFVWWR